MPRIKQNIETPWLELAILKSPDSVFWLDAKGTILHANETACRIYGYTLDAFRQMAIHDLGGDQNKGAWGDIWHIMRKGARYTEEIVHTKKNGEALPVEVSMHLLGTNRDQIASAFVRDITKRKRAEKEVEKAYHIVAQQAEEALESNASLQKALSEVKRLKSKLEQENVYLREEIKHSHNFDEIITQSHNFKQVLKQVEQVACTDATVLILGETGSGKELIARALHNLCDRKDRPLVKVNCAALPGNLIESELFGHEKGAFTGAMTQRQGRFELAHQGSIFLDEIGDLPLGLQAKLLRVLQEGEFERIGQTKPTKVDVRVIAATNRNLEEAVKSGDFREDLFYRLNVFPILIPPLRERREDISILTRHFVKKFGAKLGKSIETVPKQVMDTLEAYHWPGNVRELENLIERAVILSMGRQLTFGDWFAKTGEYPAENDINTLDEINKDHILTTLKATGWRVSGKKGAAHLLGLKPTTLEARMKKLGISRPG